MSSLPSNILLEGWSAKMCPEQHQVHRLVVHSSIAFTSDLPLPFSTHSSTSWENRWLEVGWNNLSSSLPTLGSRSLTHIQEEKGEVGLPWAVCVEYLGLATIRTLRRPVKLYIIWQPTWHYLRLPLQAELSGGSASESIDAEIRVLKSLGHSITPCGTFFAMTKSLGCPLWNWKLRPPNAIHAGLAFCISIPAACPFNPVATMECLQTAHSAAPRERKGLKLRCIDFGMVMCWPNFCTSFHFTI